MASNYSNKLGPVLNNDTEKLAHTLPICICLAMSVIENPVAHLNESNNEESDEQNPTIKPG